MVGNRSAGWATWFMVGIMALTTSSSFAQSTPPASAEAPRGKPALETRGKFIDQRIAEFMDKHGVPGLAMAIVQAPYIPRSAGYGRASLTHDELASTRTAWNIGPITQAFTAVAVFQLYESQKLDIRDAIEKHLPGLPAAWGKTTVLDLLQHASGLPDYRTAKDFEADGALMPDALIKLVATAPLAFERGTQVRQSATNFLLLGLIVERASGMSFHDFVTRHQIEPLGLRSTFFVDDFATKARTDRPHNRFKSEIPFINPIEPATGYHVIDGKLAATDPKASANLFAFGSLWSSAEDISAWDIGLAGGILVKNDANRALIYKPTTLGNGTVVPAMAGWEFTRHPGFMEIKGSSPGFSAYLSRFTAAEDLVCVTLLANKEGLDLTELARDIADSYKAGLGAVGVPEGIVVHGRRDCVPARGSSQGWERSGLRRLRPWQECRAGRPAAPPDQGPRFRQSQGRYQADAGEPGGGPRPAAASLGLGGCARTRLGGPPCFGAHRRRIRPQGRRNRRGNGAGHGNAGGPRHRRLRALRARHPSPPHSNAREWTHRSSVLSHAVGEEGTRCVATGR